MNKKYKKIGHSFKKKNIILRNINNLKNRKKKEKKIDCEDNIIDKSIKINK
jgi:hypothetical protein